MIWKVLLILLWIQPSTGNSQQLNRTIDSLNEALPTVEQSEERIKLYYSLAKEWAEINFDSSYWYATAISELANQKGDPQFMMMGYRATGLAYDYNYQMDSAGHYYEMALEISKDLSDTTNTIMLNFNLGTVELLKGNYVSVLPWYNEAIRLLEISRKDQEILLNIYNNLGIVYRRIDRFEDAKNIYQRALSILEPVADQQIRADIFTNMGNVMISLQEYDSAEYYYLEVKKYAEAQNNRLSLAFAHNGLGMVEESRGNEDAAISYFDQVISEKDIEEDYVRFTALRYKADILSRQGFFDSAAYYFEMARDIFNEEEYPDEVKELYLQFADHYERQGQLSPAMEFLRKHYSLKDHLVSQEVIDRTSEWEERYQAKERENQIINLRLQNEEASLIAARQRNQRNIFLSLTLLMVVIVGFSFYMYRLKQKTNKSLEEKNALIRQALADKELLMKEIHHRVKNNLQVISSLLNLQSNFIEDEKANAAMLESKNRVHSMALIHQRLYQNENLTEIDLEEYLDQLIDNLHHSYSTEDKEISIDLLADTLMMDVDKVILIGLIVNELITNSFKYAFKSRNSGSILVKLQEDEGLISLTVSDNGVGMGSEPTVKQGSLGTLLVNDLSKKLKAELSYDLVNGTTVSIKFPYKK